jgi:hypothetical protein
MKMLFTPRFLIAIMRPILVQWLHITPDSGTVFPGPRLA